MSQYNTQRSGLAAVADYPEGTPSENARHPATGGSQSLLTAQKFRGVYPERAEGHITRHFYGFLSPKAVGIICHDNVQLQNHFLP